MARFMELDEEGKVEWAKWVAERPPIIQDLARRFPPGVLYLLKDTGKRVYIVSYDEEEDGGVSMKVAVDGRFNCVVMERTVFGIKPEDLTECDLPGPDEILGTLGDMIDAGIDHAEGKTN